VSPLPAPGPASGRLEALVELVSALRGPEGCPWDRAQTAADLRAYLLEEAHEVAAALDADDWDALRAELGDLLFQVVFLASLAHDAGAFDLGAVIDGVHRKMVERHPHVFGDHSARDAAQVRESWERRKAEQRAGDSHLDGVASSLPALVAAYRLTQKAAGVGFDWPDADAVLDKLDEELAELRAARGGERASEGVREEVGDILFTAANLARKLGVDPEGALARANLKFRSRFAAIERGLAAAGRRLGAATLDELDRLWEEAKRAEAGAPRTE
jgi:ATP diphosphatase